METQREQKTQQQNGLAGEAISRILCATSRIGIALDAKRGVATIPLGLRSLERLDAAYPRVVKHPSNRSRDSQGKRAGPALPSYLALLHAGFSVPPMSPPERWALTPPFHPCQYGT